MIKNNLRIKNNKFIFNSIKKIRILLVEDDDYFRSFLKNKLHLYGEICESSTYNESIRLLKKEDFDLVFIDLHLHGENVGIKILQEAKNKKIYSVILTDFDSPQYVQGAYELGCEHYITKDQFEIIIDSVIADCLDILDGSDFDQIIKNEIMTEDQNLIQELRNLRSRLFVERPILLLGETGVGKGKLAEFIHKSWGGTKSNFVAINASAIPDNLIESEFFGHVKGAFTGANENKIGKLMLADRGTLFLDEIGSMPLSMQKKLLKALEEKQFYAVGGTTPIKVNFRLITATCDDIYKKMKEETFRSDLFYRINGVTIKIPPLRERKKDILLLIKFFLSEGPRKVHITDNCFKFLLNYSWPGNIRELKAFVNSIFDKKNGIIDAFDLPASFIKQEDCSKFTTSSILATSTTNENFVKSKKDTIINYEIFNYIKTNGIKEYFERIEEEAVSLAMKESCGLAVYAKSMLKIPHSTFYRILKRIPRDRGCYRP
ncbi:MAG: sigma-54-dependent Fis family transcriptional regulator [Oligoflexia bacterium]|nr:sigma-54-dependent Fis family transcriptional regulator [Oligoflexia bacterium]